MPGPRDAITAGLASMRDLIGQLVTYRRGNDHAQMSAVKGRSTYQVIQSDGTETQVQSTDWAIAAASLTLAGDGIEPRPGDKIIETVGSKEITYEVMELAGDKAWTFVDSSDTTMRIHSKRVM